MVRPIQSRAHAFFCQLEVIYRGIFGHKIISRCDDVEIKPPVCMMIMDVADTTVSRSSEAVSRTDGSIIRESPFHQVAIPARLHLCNKLHSFAIIPDGHAAKVARIRPAFEYSLRRTRAHANARSH